MFWLGFCASTLTMIMGMIELNALPRGVNILMELAKTDVTT